MVKCDVDGEIVLGEVIDFDEDTIKVKTDSKEVEVKKVTLFIMLINQIAIILLPMTLYSLNIYM